MQTWKLPIHVPESGPTRELKNAFGLVSTASLIGASNRFV